MWLTGTSPCLAYQDFAALSGSLDDALQARIFRQRRAIDRGVKLPGNQHFGDVLPFAGADDAARLGGFGDMPILERHPLHPAEIDAVVVFENAADPHPGGLAIRTHTDALARQLA